MKIKCQECNTVVDIDENDYEKEVEHSVECPLCSSEIHFTIHKETPKVESVPPTPSVKKVVKATAVTKTTQEEKKEPIVKPKVENERPQEEVTYDPIPAPSNSNKTIMGILIGVIVLAALVGGYLYYDKVYLPEKIDAESPRYYTFAFSLIMRSTKVTGTDYNKLCSLPYGTELITYKKDSEWAEVKLKAKGTMSEDIKGYVSSTFLLSKTDFFWLNSIFGNDDAKETVKTSKCRIALLNYFKENKLIGQINEDMRKEAGISVVPNSTNQWQVFTKSKDAKTNTVLYKRLVDSNSRYTDFAVIIKNIVNGDRKLLYFYFDDDETPHLATEISAPPSGNIKTIETYNDYYDNNLVFKAYYTD